MNDEKKGMLAATAAYIIFGLSYLFSKMALEVSEPSILLWARFTVTFLALNLLLLTGVGKLRLKGKRILYAVLLGVLQPVLYFVFENYGLKYTTTSFTGLMSSISPVFAAVLGALILRERPNLRQWLCIAVSVAGVMLVSVGGTGGQNTVWGCVCLLIAYLLGACYSLLVRHISKEFTPFEMTYMMFAVGFVFFTGWAFAGNGLSAFRMLGEAASDGRFVISVLYLGLCASVGAYFLSNYSLTRLPVARSTIFSNLSTVVSVLAGVVVMKDPFGWIHTLSFMLILAGVAGVNFFRTKEPAALSSPD